MRRLPREFHGKSRAVFPATEASLCGTSASREHQTSAAKPTTPQAANFLRIPSNCYTNSINLGRETPLRIHRQCNRRAEHFSTRRLRFASLPPTVSAIIPARNEESVIATCIESLARQPEVLKLWSWMINPPTEPPACAHSSAIPALALAASRQIARWLGRENTLWTGVQQAKGDWLLFTDAERSMIRFRSPRSANRSGARSRLVSFRRTDYRKNVRECSSLMSTCGSRNSSPTTL